jgi:alkaline phosphatase D
MAMKVSFLYLFILSGVLSCSHKPSSKGDISQLRPNEITIAFGSCARSNDSIPIFNDVIAQKPAVWVWLGDIMYGDSHDMTVLKKKYDIQKNNPRYKKLASTAKVIGIWDDHDYGINDGGKNYSVKDDSKELLLDFLDVADNDPVRDHDGVYSEHDIAVGDKLVKIILLDTRYFRDTLDADFNSSARYLPNQEGDILGEGQWQWLESTLKNSKADFHIVGSGIQVIAEEQGYEKWANFPKSRDRFFKLLAKIQPKPLMIISGDRHIAEISGIEIPGLGYPLYDFTASGLTHTWSSPWDEPNRFRVDSLIAAKNFGLLKLDLDNANPELVMEIRGENDELLQQRKIVY